MNQAFATQNISHEISEPVDTSQRLDVVMEDPDAEAAEAAAATNEATN